MPFIEEDKLAELHNEVEILREEKENLEKDVVASNVENRNLSRYLKALRIILLFLTVPAFVFGLLYFQTKKDIKKTTIVQQEEFSRKIDSIQSIYESASFVSDNNTDDNNTDDYYESNDDKDTNTDFIEDGGLIYTIQIGAFKEFDLSDYPEEELKNFRRMPNKDLHTYSIGKFTNVKQAKSFLNEIRKIGIKDAFILPIKDGERIGLKQAIALENQ